MRADYYAKLAQMSLQLQRAEAAAKAQAAKTASGRVSISAASNGRKKKSVQEQVAQYKSNSAKRAAAQQRSSVTAYVTVDGVKMTRQELERRIESGSVEQDERGNYRFSYQRYPYWRHMTAQ